MLKTSDAGGVWVTQSSGTTKKLKDVVFPGNAVRGFEVGHAGAVARSAE